MAVKIGHASIDERGKIQGGSSGDQSLKEVCTRDYYGSWTAVIRPKSSADAEKIAVAMEQACANNYIGYDQGQRTTLWQEALKVNWNLSKIVVKCECDCSSLVAVCVRCAGISISKDIYTGNQLQALKNTGKFDVFTSSDYTQSSAKLKRGDILLKNGHTAIVLSNGSSVSASTTKPSSTTAPKKDNSKVDSARSFDKSLAGTYKTTSDLHLRAGAGKNKNSLVIMPKGTKCRNYGYYTTLDGTKWLLIQATVRGVTYTGFSSSKYLAK